MHYAMQIIYLRVLSIRVSFGPCLCAILLRHFIGQTRQLDGWTNLHSVDNFTWDCGLQRHNTVVIRSKGSLSIEAELCNINQ